MLHRQRVPQINLPCLVGYTYDRSADVISSMTHVYRCKSEQCVVDQPYFVGDPIYFGKAQKVRAHRSETSMTTTLTPRHFSLFPWQMPASAPPPPHPCFHHSRCFPPLLLLHRLVDGKQETGAKASITQAVGGTGGNRGQRRSLQG